MPSKKLNARFSDALTAIGEAQYDSITITDNWLSDGEFQRLQKAITKDTKLKKLKLSYHRDTLLRVKETLYHAAAAHPNLASLPVCPYRDCDHYVSFRKNKDTFIRLMQDKKEKIIPCHLKLKEKLSSLLEKFDHKKPIALTEIKEVIELFDTLEKATAPKLYDPYTLYDYASEHKSEVDSLKRRSGMIQELKGGTLSGITFRNNTDVLLYFWLQLIAKVETNPRDCLKNIIIDDNTYTSSEKEEEIICLPDLVKQIETLSFEKCTISSVFAKKLLEAVESAGGDCKVTKLIFDDCKFENEAAYASLESMLESFKKNELPLSLELENGVFNTSFTDIFKKVSPPITSLHLIKTRFQPSTMRGLVDSIHAMPQLEELTLTDCHIDSRDMKTLMEGLKNAKNLKKFSLDNADGKYSKYLLGLDTLLWEEGNSLETIVYGKHATYSRKDVSETIEKRKTFNKDLIDCKEELEQDRLTYKKACDRYFRFSETLNELREQDPQIHDVVEQYNALFDTLVTYGIEEIRQKKYPAKLTTYPLFKLLNSTDELKSTYTEKKRVETYQEIIEILISDLEGNDNIPLMENRHSFIVKVERDFGKDFPALLENEYSSRVATHLAQEKRKQLSEQLHSFEKELNEGERPCGVPIREYMEFHRRLSILKECDALELTDLVAQYNDLYTAIVNRGIEEIRRGDDVFILLGHSLFQFISQKTQKELDIEYSQTKQIEAYKNILDALFAILEKQDNPNVKVIDCLYKRIKEIGESVDERYLDFLSVYYEKLIDLYLKPSVSREFPEDCTCLQAIEVFKEFDSIEQYKRLPLRKTLAEKVYNAAYTAILETNENPVDKSNKLITVANDALLAGVDKARDMVTTAYEAYIHCLLDRATQGDTISYASQFLVLAMNTIDDIKQTKKLDNVKQLSEACYYWLGQCRYPYHLSLPDYKQLIEFFALVPSDSKHFEAVKLNAFNLVRQFLSLTLNEIDRIQNSPDRNKFFKKITSFKLDVKTQRKLLEHPDDVNPQTYAKELYENAKKIMVNGPHLEVFGNMLALLEKIPSKGLSEDTGFGFEVIPRAGGATGSDDYKPSLSSTFTSSYETDFQTMLKNPKIIDKKSLDDPENFHGVTLLCPVTGQIMEKPVMLMVTSPDKKNIGSTVEECVAKDILSSSRKDPLNSLPVTGYQRNNTMESMIESFMSQAKAAYKKQVTPGKLYPEPSAPPMDAVLQPQKL